MRCGDLVSPLPARGPKAMPRVPVSTLTWDQLQGDPLRTGRGSQNRSAAGAKWATFVQKDITPSDEEKGGVGFRCRGPGPAATHCRRYHQTPVFRILSQIAPIDSIAVSSVWTTI
jgi:hypothetical protein